MGLCKTNSKMYVSKLWDLPLTFYDRQKQDNFYVLALFRDSLLGQCFLDNVNFIKYVHTYGLLDERYALENYFDRIEDVTMNTLKIYYLTLLNTITRENYTRTYTYLAGSLNYKFSKGSHGLQKIKSMDIFSKSSEHRKFKS